MADPALPSHFRLDSRAVKILAHPLRSRLLSALRRGGPATATQLAAELRTNTGATSYHLRKLASVGLVVDTEEGEGKRRLWAASTEETRVEASDFAGDEDAETALGWLARDWLRHFSEKFNAWLDVETSWPMPWRDTLGMNDSTVVVTAEQLAAMRAEISDVVYRYRRVGQGNPDAQRVAAYYSFYPIDLERRPRA